MKESIEGSPQSVLYGMRQEDLTDAIWRQVIITYFETVGGGYIPDEQDLSRRFSLEAASTNSFGEFRYGSRFSVHSKLRIRSKIVEGQRLISFAFDPNVDPDERQWAANNGDDVDVVAVLFRQRVDSHLVECGVAFPLP